MEGKNSVIVRLDHMGNCHNGASICLHCRFSRKWPIFLINLVHRLDWRNEFFINDSPFVKHKLAVIWSSICSFELSWVEDSSQCATPHFASWSHIFMKILNLFRFHFFLQFIKSEAARFSLVGTYFNKM